MTSIMTTVHQTRNIISDAQKGKQQGKDKAGANQSDSQKGKTPEHLPFSASSALVYRTAISPISRRQCVHNDAMITNTNDRSSEESNANRPDVAQSPPGGGQFGREFGRFGSVWSSKTKSRSQDGYTNNINLVDLVDIHTRGVRGARASAPAGTCLRPRAGGRTSLPPDEFDQIDQIGKCRIAVQRLSFGRRRPNPTKQGGNLDQIGDPPGGLWLVGGVST